MVLGMACPTKRQGSDNWYFRRQIPADVRAILAKLPKSQRPANWYRTHISISLRWSQAFRHTTATQVFQSLDKEVDWRIEELRAFALTLTQGATAQARRRVMGIQLISDTPSHPLPVIAAPPPQGPAPELDDNLGDMAPAA